ncbi:unnamed protein product [Rotaria socialis]|uniref:Reverse transcriptase domain-containing protein n=1 Tax=Rotaria socialis TaxID=392032 RepID=A0A820XCQ2_9BILA|nr:unnamed protein product [Rotaria socialis]CAF3711762.1 unnamed protein product [Rotaria socialis]CAF4245058.1 unnamed protein product [Rotaria socialis]CAF4530416.1 unnamed protein product [Rotaria socialis]
MWFPALLSTLAKLEMPLPVIKWIASWLQNRTFSIHYGDTISRTIKMHVGTPQGSILAAKLFRLHIHFLPSIFFQTTAYPFADDLAILMTWSLEKKFSLNIVGLEERAKHVMCILEKYAENNLLPVNIKKTKAALVHNVIAPQLPKLEYKKQKIEVVPSFKYLGGNNKTKLGWGLYIDDKLKTIRKTYNAMKTLCLQYSQK